MTRSSCSRKLARLLRGDRRFLISCGGVFNSEQARCRQEVAMREQNPSRMIKFGQAIVLIVLFAMLLFAIVWSMIAWTSAQDAELSIHGGPS
jgi:hypothetical protein